MKTNLFLTLLAGALVTALPAGADSTIAATNHYAWGGNIGWIDFRAERPNAGDGFHFGEFYCSGNLWAPTIGWINCGSGAPQNGINYSNADGSDCGVNHYGNGDLYGLAWSANAGWINFGWSVTPGNLDRPRVNLLTGEFSGYVWSANCGWINLGSGQLKTDRMEIPDTDGDGISDVFEIAYTGGLTNMDATSDLDGDGFTDKAEYYALTNPLDPQSNLRITKVEPASADGSATKVTWTSVAARRYAIESMTELGGTNQWHRSNLDPVSFDADSGFTTRTNFDVVSPTRFFRVQAIIPLQP